MSGDLAFACKCGAVAGTLREAGSHNGDRVVCHCDSCQAFAWFCDDQDRVLDAHAGTDLYNTGAAQMSIERGRENLACVHLTEKPTLRWYATCCSTPMFNTYANGKVPYVTALVANCDADRRDAMLQEPQGHLFLKDAPGDTSRLKKMSAFAMIRIALPRMLEAVFSGDRRRAALFDSVTLEPIAKPHRLTAIERADLHAKVSA